MRNIDLVALSIFKTVAEEGGIARAAAKLHRVPSNVTTRVQQLERRLGVQLFFRQNRRLVLSPQGQILLTYAEQLLRLATEAEAALRDDTPRGPLRIGTMESTAATRLPPVLARYHRTYPQVRIELITGTVVALMAKVVDNDIEAAFVASAAIVKGLDSQPVFVEELVLIAPASFAKVKTAKDLNGATVLAFGVGCPYRRCLEEWLARTRVAPARIMECNSYHTIVACVAAGTGVAVVPRAVIRAVPAGKVVQTFSLPSDLSKTRTVLVWRKGYRSPALDALRKELGKGGGC
ncbi:MAG: LysR family transcriptional regulator [Gammaproteobacteria bacterium]|nr:LysR family transcriptional regulator [Gammaproteobacteria bacterium]